jgi:hypothetical protein
MPDSLNLTQPIFEPERIRGITLPPSMLEELQLADSPRQAALARWREWMNVSIAELQRNNDLACLLQELHRERQPAPDQHYCPHGHRNT